jgi:hypothetical protein
VTGKQKSTASASPLREALAAKTNLRTYHDIAVRPVEDIEAAQRNLQLAQQMQAATMLHDDEAVRTKAVKVVAEAQAARDACFHRIWFRSLGDVEFDALVALHPPLPGQDADRLAWNPTTFEPALLEACVVDSDLTAEEWADELADESRWSGPDKRAVSRAAMAAQRQTLAELVPKG